MVTPDQLQDQTEHILHCEVEEEASGGPGGQ